MSSCHLYFMTVRKNTKILAHKTLYVVIQIKLRSYSYLI